jgi:hypothetical protein
MENMEERQVEERHDKENTETTKLNSEIIWKIHQQIIKH